MLGAMATGNAAGWGDKEGATEGSQQPVRMRRIGNSTDESLKRESNVIKAALANAQQARILASATMWTIRLPSAILADAVKTGKEFAEAHKNQSGHKHGPPHLHVWRKTLAAIVHAAESIPEKGPDVITHY